MSLEINDWSGTPSNNNFTPPDGAPESTTKLSHINNIIREVMGVVARWSKDTSVSTLASSGTGQNFTMNLNRTLTAYFDGLSFRWRNHTTNQSNPTLSLNGLAGKSIVDLDGQPIRAGKLDGKPIETFYSAFYDKFIVTNYRDEKTVPIGVTMLFMMASAPIGWQQFTAWHDLMIRVVNDGSGGRGGGNWTISGLSTESVAHTHAFDTISDQSTAGVQVGNGGNGVTILQHTHRVRGTTATENILHTHQGDGIWRPAYVNSIVCSRVD